MQTDKFADLDGAIRDAVKLKFLEKPLTKEQIAELIADSAAQEIEFRRVMPEMKTGRCIAAARLFAVS